MLLHCDSKKRNPSIASCKKEKHQFRNGKKEIIVPYHILSVIIIYIYTYIQWMSENCQRQKVWINIKTHQNIYMNQSSGIKAEWFRLLYWNEMPLERIILPVKKLVDNADDSIGYFLLSSSDSLSITPNLIGEIEPNQKHLVLISIYVLYFYSKFFWIFHK